MADLKQLHEAIVTGKAPLAVETVKAALDEGVDPQEIVNGYMIPAMDEVGDKFEKNEYFVPELLIAARAMKQALEIVKPKLVEKGAKPMGRVAIATVKGDLHDIGKNLVAAMLEGAGFEIIDLGVDAGPDKFLAAVKEKNATHIAMSALLTTTMPQMKNVIDALSAEGLRDKVKVMIGGAPITQQYADEIGADGYSDNAAGAVTIARQLAAAL
ncbi:MAG: Methionine synthase [candidate division BRC1 bacterium ADurb.BinA364]|nr:MAG: Methionine synthase [candidate division BRC1 bacterium ADurb.BinA364]